MSELSLGQLKQNFDDWVKEMNSKVSELNEVPKTMVANIDNIQHNYELVTELRDEIDDLKEEIKLLKLMHLVALKEKKLKH